MRLRVTRHLIEGAEECDGDVCQGQVQEEVVGHSSHPCMRNLSPCQHVTMSTCQHVIMSTCQCMVFTLPSPALVHTM